MHKKSCEVLHFTDNFATFVGAESRTWTGTESPPRDFKSLASAYSAISASGGASRIRTGDQGFADHCLTTWLRRHNTSIKISNFCQFVNIIFTYKYDFFCFFVFLSQKNVQSKQLSFVIFFLLFNKIFIFCWNF